MDEDNPTVMVAATVSVEDEGMRLDQFAFKYFPDHLCSRSRSRKAAHAGRVRVNGLEKESSYFVVSGEEITLIEMDTGRRKLFPIDVDVVYEDDFLAVVGKPPGILTNGNRFRTLENALPHNLRPSPVVDALAWPRPVHRLDRATQGLVVVAKTQAAEVHLNRQFQHREVQKTYRAVVSGRLEGEGVVRVPIEGRSAETRWLCVEMNRCLRTQWMTTVKLWPKTGRTHQLRRHMALLGHPITGDVLYGKEGQIYRGKGLFLSAEEIELTHPVTGEVLHLVWPEPGKFQSLRERQTRRWQKFYGGTSHWN